MASSELSSRTLALLVPLSDCGLTQRLKVLQENNTSSVTLHDDYPQDVACFVHYLCYHHYYPSTNDADEGLSTLDLLKVALVNKYDEAKISTITLIENTNEDRGRNWARFIRHSNLYVLADKYDVPGLKEIAMEAMVDLMHASDHLVVWDLVGRLSASGVDESKWKDSITEYLDACVAEFLEDDRFYEWIIRHKLVKQMMKAAFREVKEIP